MAFFVVVVAEPGGRRGNGRSRGVEQEALSAGEAFDVVSELAAIQFERGRYLSLRQPMDIEPCLLVARLIPARGKAVRQGVIGDIVEIVPFHLDAEVAVG